MSDQSLHHLLSYEYADDVLQRRGPHREAHLARIRQQQEAGRVTLAGATGDPPSGAAIVWRDTPAEEIEAFVAGDPYVVAGLVTRWRIEPWTLV